MGVILISNHRDILPIEEDRWRSRIMELEVREIPKDMKKRFREPIHPMGWLKAFDEQVNTQEFGHNSSDDDM